MDWAVNEFSVSGSPVLHVFDTFLRMGIEKVTANTAATSYAKTAHTLLSVSQQVFDNTAATAKGGITAYS